MKKIILLFFILILVVNTASAAVYKSVPLTLTQGEESSQSLIFTGEYERQFGWVYASGEAASWVTPRRIDFGAVDPGETVEKYYTIQVPEYQNPGYYELKWIWGCKYVSGSTCKFPEGDTLLYQITVKAKPKPKATGYQYIPLTITQGEETSRSLSFTNTGSYDRLYAWADASGEAASWVSPRRIDFGSINPGDNSVKYYTIKVPEYQYPGYYEMMWTWGCEIPGTTCEMTTGDVVLQITVKEKPEPISTITWPVYTPPPESSTDSDIIGFVFLILFIIWIFVSIWVAKDANKRGKSGTLWGIAAFFFGLIGLLVYFISRPKGNLVFCNYCGKEKLESLPQCPHCKNPPLPSYMPAPAYKPVSYPAVPQEPEEAESESASVSLHGEKTEVVLGEDIVLKLSAVSIITQPAMTVQVILIPPSGMSVTSSEFVTSGAGQYTTTYTIDPGIGRDIEVRIKTNQVGEFAVKGRIVYYFGDDKSTAEDHKLTLPIKVRHDKEPTHEVKTGKVSTMKTKGEKGSAFDDERRKQHLKLPPENLDSDTTNYLSLGVDTASTMLDAEIEKAESDALHVQGELKKNEEVLDRLADRLANKEISEQTYNDLKNKYKRKVSELKSKVAGLENEAAKKQKIRSFIQEKGKYYT